MPVVTGARSTDVAMDFFTTLAASNRDGADGVAPVNPCFRYLPVALDPITGRPRGADLFATFDGVTLRGPATHAPGEADGILLHGGVEYLRLEASAGQREAAMTIRSDAPAMLRVRVARVR
jgi:hypothetical protein